MKTGILLYTTFYQIYISKQCCEDGKSGMHCMQISYLA